MAYLDNNGVTYLWNKIKTLFNKGITGLKVSGRTITYTKGDGTTGTISTQDTTYGNMKGATASADGASGLVPAPTKGNEGKYLKADGTWGTPANTTYDDMKGATSSAAGTHGLVPAPTAGAATRYLRSDGTWQVPPDTKYTHPTTSGNKHIPSGGSSGQILRWSADGTATWGADKDTTYTDFKASTETAVGVHGLVPAPPVGISPKILSSNNGWATLFFNNENADKEQVEIEVLMDADGESETAGTIFVYGATKATAGAMSAVDKTKLDGIATNANNYTHPTTSGNKHIPSGGSLGQILRWSADGTAVWGADKDTTYSDMKGATSSAAGTHGLVPAPTAGASTRYLRSDGTWQVPPNTTYGVASSSSNGLMSSSDKTKLDALPTNATLSSTYATKAEIINMYKYMGSVADATKLPTAGQRTGDVYNIETASKYGGAGMNVAWNGSAWDPLGEIFTITAITNAEIDAICV